MTHPVVAVLAIVVTLLAAALVMPTRYHPRPVLVTSALVMGAGILVAAACSLWHGGSVPRIDLLMQTSLTSAVLVTFAMTPPMGGRFCRSSAAMVVGAVIMATSMVVSELV
jgi:hypothetical protein